MTTQQTCYFSTLNPSITPPGGHQFPALATITITNTYNESETRHYLCWACVQYLEDHTRQVELNRANTELFELLHPDDADLEADIVWDINTIESVGEAQGGNTWGQLSHGSRLLGSGHTGVSAIE